jgi:hypothetical protein
MTESKDNAIVQAIDSKSRSVGILRVVGYGLVILATFNLVDTLVPPRIMDPIWEFQSIGAIVDSLPIPLLGLAFIFYGEASQRGKGEQLVVRILSYVCLLIAILLFLTIPLMASNVLRINQDIAAQYSTQFSQQMTQIDQVEQQLNQATDAEIKNYLDSQGVSIEPDASKSLKQQLIERLDETRAKIKDDSQVGQTSKRNAILKSAVKWILGSLVSSFIFIYLWRLTKWARPPMRTGKRRKVGSSSANRA